MRHAMPPLSALRAFEAAARHLSLTKAAQELGVTPGALETYLRLSAQRPARALA